MIMIGNIVTRDELLQHYPKKYAVLTDVVWKGADVVSGKLVAIVAVADIWDFKRQNLDNEYHYEYLGDNEFGGFIHVKDYKISIK